MNVEKIGKSILIGLILISITYPIVFVFGISRASLTILFYIIPIASLSGYLFTKKNVLHGECEIYLRNGSILNGNLYDDSEDFLFVRYNSENILVKKNDVIKIVYKSGKKRK